jgi:transcription elongation factor GreA
MAKETIVTEAGYAKLQAEIEDLSGRGRREVAERIKESRDFGDISENAEYDAAKNDQAMLEARIATLEDRLRTATIVDTSQVENDVVQVGTTVHLKDQKTSKSVKYEIVGSTEADPLGGKLSNESPIGKALIGHKRNDIVKVPVPRGPQRQLKITKIEAS